MLIHFFWCLICLMVPVCQLNTGWFKKDESPTVANSGWWGWWAWWGWFIGSPPVGADHVHLTAMGGSEQPWWNYSASCP